MNDDYQFIIGDAAQPGLATGSVDFTIGSPPYMARRTYDSPANLRGPEAWAAWMLTVTKEWLRVTKKTGSVMWVVGASVDDGAYQPGPEILMAEAYRAGIRQMRPHYWTKNGTGGKPFRNCVEYVLWFAHEDGDPFCNPLAIAEPYKYTSGGRWRVRGVDGKRQKGGTYPVEGKLAVPPNYFYVTVGGGHMGHKLAHDNEAPYPMKLASRFIRTCTQPGDLVADPFSGSGTTVNTAHVLGRRSIGLDQRQSQCDLGAERMRDVVAKELGESQRLKLCA